MFFCPRCKETKPLNENTRQKQNKRLCTICTKRRNDDENFFPHIVRHARYRTKHRNEMNREHEFDIDVKYIKELWDRQDGKCSISGVAMQLKTTCD